MGSEFRTHGRKPKAMRSRAILILALTFAWWSVGCSFFFESPGVRVVEVGIRSLGLTGGTVEVTVALSNPNGAALEVEGFLYQLEVGGSGRDTTWVTLADGISDRKLRVPARDSLVVEVPVPFEYEGVGAALRSLFDRGEVEYRARGEVWVRGPVGRIRVPYRHEGVLGL